MLMFEWFCNMPHLSFRMLGYASTYTRKSPPVHAITIDPYSFVILVFLLFFSTFMTNIAPSFLFSTFPLWLFCSPKSMMTRSLISINVKIWAHTNVFNCKSLSLLTLPSHFPVISNRPFLKEIQSMCWCHQWCQNISTTKCLNELEFFFFMKITTDMLINI